MQLGWHRRVSGEETCVLNSHAVIALLPLLIPGRTAGQKQVTALYRKAHAGVNHAAVADSRLTERDGSPERRPLGGARGCLSTEVRWNTRDCNSTAENECDSIAERDHEPPPRSRSRRPRPRRATTA